MFYLISMGDHMKCYCHVIVLKAVFISKLPGQQLLIVDGFRKQ